MQSLARHSPGCPFPLGFGAETPIEINGRFVPVKDDPLQAAPASRLDQHGEMGQEKFPCALAAVLRQDEEILEPDAGFPEKGREAREKEGKTDGHLPDLGNDDLGCGRSAKEVFSNVLLPRDTLMRKFLVFRQAADEVEDEPGILYRRFSDRDLLAHQRLLPGTCHPRGHPT